MRYLTIYYTHKTKKNSQQFFNVYFCNFFGSIEQFYNKFSSNSQAECRDTKVEGTKNPPHHLNALLDHLLHPQKSIDDQDTIDWCHWLVGGGRSYDDFASNVREFDSTALCGLVWTADFWAYRCRTCGISQCMSLCADCFKDGNHEGEHYMYTHFVVVIFDDHQ